MFSRSPTEENGVNFTAKCAVSQLVLPSCITLLRTRQAQTFISRRFLWLSSGTGHGGWCELCSRSPRYTGLALLAQTRVLRNRR